MDIRHLARAQDGLLTRSQLRELGIGSDAVRHRIRSGRWAARAPKVVSLFTGDLSPSQQQWLAVLHGGSHAVVAGLTGLTRHGLRGWDRDEVEMLVAASCTVTALPGIAYTRTRRDLPTLTTTRWALPTLRVEPSALLWASAASSERSAQGILAACVQQRLTTPERLAGELDRLAPLRRARLFRRLLCELADGAQALSEVEIGRLCDELGFARPRRQTRRRDASGRPRYTDCEWDLPGGRVLVLEIDGSFHMSAEQWEDDIQRQRALTTPSRIVLRATAREIRDYPEQLARDLRLNGVPLAGRACHDEP